MRERRFFSYIVVGAPQIFALLLLAAYAAQWQGLSADYRGKMLAGIVGFALQVTDIQCKLKLNQHRPESHAKLHAAYQAGSEQGRGLAHWMERIGLVKEA